MKVIEEVPAPKNRFFSETPIVRKCETCRYGAQAPIDPNTIGQPRPVICRRFPPAAQLIQLQHGVTLTANFPMMQQNEWCFEYQQKEH